MWRFSSRQRSASAGRRANGGGKMPVERGQDTRELVLSRHGRLIPTKRICVALPLIKEAGTQPVAQLNAAPAVSAAKERVPSPFIPLHPHTHHPSLTLHLEEEDLAGDDRDGFA